MNAEGMDFRSENRDIFQVNSVTCNMLDHQCAKVAAPYMKAVMSSMRRLCNGWRGLRMVDLFESSSFRGRVSPVGRMISVCS